MPGAILTLTEREVEVLGFALMKTMRHHRMNWEAASPGHYKDDYRRKMDETRDLIAKLDQAPAAPLSTWSDHDRNIPADEQDEGGAL
jgi:hypothetical protein